MNAHYTKSPEPQTGRLEDSQVWQEACSLGELIYSKLHELPKSEEWDTTRKLQSSACDLMFYAAQAVGGSTPGSSEYDWSNTRKSAGALKTMYRFAGRQKFIELEPEVMVRFDKLIASIDGETRRAYDEAEERNAKEFEMWVEKYKLWKATNL